MAYVTGTSNTIADLLTAIQNACTANGWALAGSVIKKGTCCIELKVSGSRITQRAGTGTDGSNNLTGIADTSFGRLGDSFCGIAFTFPVTYEVFIHTAPDEVYVVINYQATCYLVLAWGVSAMPGLAGTGNWYCAPDGSGAQIMWVSAIGQSGWSGSQMTSLFCRYSKVAMGVDHRLDSATWATEGSHRDWTSIAIRQPNQWNSETILHPIRVYATRPSGFVSPVLECAHARFCEITNVTDGQIITLGSDRWKLYPWFKRGKPLTNIATSQQLLDSAQFGHAFRYDGP